MSSDEGRAKEGYLLPHSLILPFTPPLPLHADNTWEGKKRMGEEGWCIKWMCEKERLGKLRYVCREKLCKRK
jgi:hypothetical protein